MSLCQSGFHSINDFRFFIWHYLTIDTPLVCWFSSRHRVPRSFLHHSWSHPSCFTYLDDVYSVSVHLLYDLSHRPFSWLDTWWVHCSSQLWSCHIGPAAWIALFVRAATSLVSDIGLTFVSFSGVGLSALRSTPTWSAKIYFAWLSHRDLSSIGWSCWRHISSPVTIPPGILPLQRQGKIRAWDYSYCVIIALCNNYQLGRYFHHLSPLTFNCGHVNFNQLCMPSVFLVLIPIVSSNAFSQYRNMFFKVKTKTSWSLRVFVKFRTRWRRMADGELTADKFADFKVGMIKHADGKMR